MSGGRWGWGKAGTADGIQGQIVTVVQKNSGEWEAVRSYMSLLQNILGHFSSLSYRDPSLFAARLSFSCI